MAGADAPAGSFQIFLMYIISEASDAPEADTDTPEGAALLSPGSCFLGASTTKQCPYPFRVSEQDTDAQMYFPHILPAGTECSFLHLNPFPESSVNGLPHKKLLQGFPSPS